MYSIKNVKTFQSHDGGGFELSLYKEGKRIAIVGNAGQGGEDTWYPLKHDKDGYAALRIAEEEMEVWCKKNLPQLKCFSGMLDATPDIHIGDLLSEFLHTKDLKRLLKKTVIIQAGVIYTLKSKYDPSHKQKILSVHADSIILNDMPFADALATFKIAVGY